MGLINMPRAQRGERIAAVADKGGEVEACIHMLAHRLTRQRGHAHAYRGDDGNVVVFHARHPGAEAAHSTG